MRIILLVLIVLFQYTNLCFSCTEEERNGLLKFQAFAGYSNKASDCCGWKRVKCDNTTRRVVWLNLQNYSTSIDFDDNINNVFYERNVLDASLFLPFPELQYLNLSWNGYAILQNHQDLEKLNKLEVLDLSYNEFNITRVSQSLSALASLTVLDLKCNFAFYEEISELSFSSFGRDLGRLTKLKVLNLSENGLIDPRIFQDLGKLHKLEVLDLSVNQFNNVHIWQSLSTLTSLKVLDLSRSRIDASLSDVGQDLCKLRNLRELYLDSIWLSGSIPPCFDNLTSLKALNLSWNNLVGFRHDLGRLHKLEVLDLSCNKFNDNRIFQSLSTLTSLTFLDLSYNVFNVSLSDGGQGLCKLRNLQELHLCENEISGSIPPCFVNLTSLKALDLSDNNLVGKLHPSLHFTSLEYLSLSDNPQFDASPMFSSLASREFQFRYLDLSDCNINISATDLLNVLHNGPKLLNLDLSNNNVHGEFPNSIFEKNFNLIFLGLRNNSLTGRIHLPVGHPVDLNVLDVSYNHLHGELQPNLGYVLPKLSYLNTANNSFAGEIPTSIHAMKDLVYIDFSGNNLSGKLPERLDLSCKRLRWIQLSNNRLEGRIPDNFFNLTELGFLDLSNNHFSGHIPTNNFQSFDLATFDVSQNRLSGRIPSWVSNLTNTYQIDISENQLSGSVPSSLITQPFLMHLYLQRNKLTGPLPNALPFNASSLTTLDVHENNLSGRIPNWFGFLLNLRVLSLKGNHFSGSIPHELCRLQNIEIMDISRNIFSGSLPLCFTNITFGKNNDGMWPEHDIISFYSFGLDEPIRWKPDESFYQSFNGLKDVQFVMKSRTNSYKGANIGFMSGMDLSCNNLEGDIPLNIGDLIELHAMNLSHNQFTGVIPSSLSKMKQIESLDLSHNKLSGEIPSNLTRLSFLVAFDVAYNNLSGRLPEMVAQFNTFSDTSYEGNPFLCGPPLLKQCSTNSVLANTTDRLPGWDDKYGIDRTSFLASFAATCATYLLAFVIVLCINPHWRQRWFYFIDVCLSFVFPFWSEAIHRRRI